ncbi:50S ribosomal subunit protein L15 [Pleurostoma richardsiae]|uniref:50S ribosomal subunit protein L15 n=1 Tax=Pleurostoma richardsiae TaxID=41990 RepID=A0AA38VLU5_9PEZI|nr:50S ribosomal subunit protein L15 [Pleurostoma richardsiae]
MPPRVPLLQAAQCCRASFEAPSSSPASLASLFASLSVQSRSASILANLSDNKGAYSKRIRKGRGPSSGYGKTSGRGHKGQKQHGKVKPWFQGGQTPLIFKHGRKGFDNIRAPVLSEVNLDTLQAWIDAGRIDASRQITPKELIKSGLVGSVKDGVKLLARGSEGLRSPVDILVSRASAAAIDAIERAGGKIVTRYYTKQAIKRLVKGESASTDVPLPVGSEHVEGILEKTRNGPHFYRLPDPTSRWDMEYYRDPAHRGYLSHTLQPGESPSLYFKVPTERRIQGRTRRQKKEQVEDDKLF